MPEESYKNLFGEVNFAKKKKSIVFLKPSTFRAQYEWISAIIKCWTMSLRHTSS